MAWSLQFLGYLRALSLKFQKATSKIVVFLSLPSWLSQFSWDSQQGRARKTSILALAFWNFKLTVLKYQWNFRHQATIISKMLHFLNYFWDPLWDPIWDLFWDIWDLKQWVSKSAWTNYHSKEFSISMCPFIFEITFGTFGTFFRTRSLWDPLWELLCDLPWDPLWDPI